MINIKQLTDADRGRWVCYKTTRNGIVIEEEYGRIKSWGLDFVFVVFNCNYEWENYEDYTGAACSPHKLSFVGSITRLTIEEDSPG